MADDKIIQHSHYKEDPLPRLEFSNLGYSAWLTKMHQIYQGEDPPGVPASITTSVDAFVNAGRWLWMCLACNSAITADAGQPSICVECATQGWVNVVFPSNREDVETELLKQPGHRAHAPIRQWRPGWDISVLQERTARANELIAAGVEFVRALSIGTPRLWSVGEILTASNMNTYVSDILDDLKGTNGPIEYTDAIVIDSLTTTERDALTAVNGMVIYNSTLNVFQHYENGTWVSYTDLASMRIASGVQGDILYLGSNAVPTRLAAGTDRQTLRTHGSNANPSFADLEDLRVASTTARGDVLYVGSNGRLNRLAAGTSDYFFQTKGTNADPVWSAGSVTPTFVRLTTGTSWTVPTAANLVFVEEVGGGGGGNFGASATAGRSGEGGLTAHHMFRATDLGTTVTYAIGAGGAAGTSTALAGAGGNTIFAGHGVALGGGGGVGATSKRRPSQATGQHGADGGDGRSGGAAGLPGSAGTPVTVGGGAGGTGPSGAGGAGTASLNGLGSGGGGGGGGDISSPNGGAGGVGGIPGGGGGGGGFHYTSGTAGAGGAGARGEIRIWYW